MLTRHDRDPVMSQSCCCWTLLLLLLPVASATEDAPSPAHQKSDRSCKFIASAVCERCQNFSPSLRGSGTFKKSCPGSTGHQIEVDCSNMKVPTGTIEVGDRWFASCSSVPTRINQKRQNIQGVVLFEMFCFIVCVSSSVLLCIKRKLRNKQTYTAVTQ